MERTKTFNAELTEKNLCETIWLFLKKRPVQLLVTAIVLIVTGDIINLVTKKYVDASIIRLDIMLESEQIDFHTPLHLEINVGLHSFLHSARINQDGTMCHVIASSVNDDDGSIERKSVTDVSLMNNVIIPKTSLFPSVHENPPPAMATTTLYDTSTNNDNIDNIHNPTVKIAFSNTDHDALLGVIGHVNRYVPEASCQTELTGTQLTLTLMLPNLT